MASTSTRPSPTNARARHLARPVAAQIKTPVHEVHEAVARDVKVGYTTSLKLYSRSW